MRFPPNVAFVPSGPAEEGGPFRREAFCYTALEYLTWPLGGIGSAQFGLTGAGGLDRIANRHRPDVKGMSFSFAAVSFPGEPGLARVLEGPVPRWKIWTPGLYAPGRRGSCATGDTGALHHGLPRLHKAEFFHRFPFAQVRLSEPNWPLEVSLVAWSPFIPGDADASHLPVAALSYHFRNPTRARIQPVFSYHFQRTLLRERESGPDGEILRRTEAGVVVDYPATGQYPFAAGGASVEIDGALADCAWFRGGWFDVATTLWRRIAGAAAAERPPHADSPPGEGASLWLPFELEPDEEKEITVRIAWHEPRSNQRVGYPSDAASAASGGDQPAMYRPFYATRYPAVDDVAADFRARYAELQRRTASFADALHTGDVPPVLLEAVTANLGILRSPTVLRQHDGRLWLWEGCGEWSGSCPGSCTHVWNYAQAFAHLFPSLERTLRETEFLDSQDERGHQNFRASLPIGPVDHTFHAAADGQLGGIIKVWREWQLSGDTEWLWRLWPRVKASLDYCITAWDPEKTGALTKPHHNTYDIEFWGSNGMCGSVYAGALKAGVEMANALGEEAGSWPGLLERAIRHLN
ncbi:MAG: GH116 family glycosyl-hydrolase, partial [Chthoniobacteraceae bacterium]|nr:GH116 family glycosyl-hydrolase [Chthoniobacteraceae bacterium]